MMPDERAMGMMQLMGYTVTKGESGLFYLVDTDEVWNTAHALFFISEKEAWATLWNHLKDLP